MNGFVNPLVACRSLPFAASVTSVLFCVSSVCWADTIYMDQNKLFRSARNVTTLGADLFGDKVNLYTGALEFVQTDVSLPGNSRLPVSVSRRLIAGQEAPYGLFGGWDLEIPHLHGIYSRFRGWVPRSGLATERCSDFSEPKYESGSYGSLSGWNGTEFWHGSFLYIPGMGDQELLRRAPANLAAPAGNSYPVVTRQNWQIRCLAAMDPRNGETGEAFIAVSPDGTEYRFDWLVTRYLDNLTKTSAAPEARGVASTLQADSPSDGPGGAVETPDAIGGNALARSEVWILPTKVTDRFGNTVTYTYDTTNKWQLKSIVGNDGTGTPRTITLTYITPGSTASPLVSSVSDGTRTWTYQYGAPNGQGPLQSVTLPDNSTWQLAGLAALTNGINYLGDGNCEEPGMVAAYSQSAQPPTHPGQKGNSFSTRSGTAESGCRRNACNMWTLIRKRRFIRNSSTPMR